MAPDLAISEIIVKITDSGSLCTFQVRDQNFGRMAIFRVLSQKHRDDSSLWSEACHFSNFQVRNTKFDQMPIFRVPYQKHVIFSTFKFEIQI